MGVTYTHGRDRHRRHARAVAFTLGERLLVLTSVVILAGAALTYVGRLRAEARHNPARPTYEINLNSVASADALQAPLAAVFTYPADRRFAAETMARFLQSGAERRVLANVGALARVQVPVETIDRQRNLVVFRERLDDLRRTAAENGREPPRVMPLLTPADLADLKPSFVVRTTPEFRSTALWCAIALIVPFHLVSLLWRWRGVRADRVLLAIAHLLVGIGFIVVLSRPDPVRDTLLITRYTQGVVVGVALFGAISLIDLDRAGFRDLSYLPLLGALGLSVILLTFGSGPGSSNAKVNLGPVQPIEAIRLLLALFLAGYFARRWELIRHGRAETIRNRPVPGWVHVPRLDHVLPVGIGVTAALVLFFFQKDLGPALLLSLLFLSMFAVARGGAWLAVAGLAVLVTGFFTGYLLNVSTTLAARVQMWQSPWDNAVRGGDQIAQAFWGLSAGALTGTGVGLGDTRYVPEGHTDLVLASIGEEFGFLGLLIVGACFVLMACRGFALARRASSDYAFFLAIAMTLSLAIPVLVMACGVLGLLPLTGVVTPFLSYGGSAMAANFVALGLLVSIGRAERPATDVAPFLVPVRWMSHAAVACAVLVMAFAATAQTVRADEYLVRPQLGVQADGGRRFQYNPRVLNAVRAIPRGTITDRHGLALATSDSRVLEQSAEAYERLGQRLADVCPNPAARCYPAGPSLFHVLGDANTRSNWSAANTSYVERDAEARLRGFDDRATVVTTHDRDDRPIQAVRRDFTPVVPLVRHRYEPDHPDVKAILERPRDVRITVDARLQTAVASILARAARTTGDGKGAVIVVDATTGELLASVSYPWPNERSISMEPPVFRPAVHRPAAHGPAADPLLDRARYGLYPPGSTFKIITAAAALRQDPLLAQQTYVCQRLPSKRIGARIPGFGRPIHDDVRDVHEHGRIALHDALVRSCNAYFAQLAVTLGAETMTRTAATAGIALNTSRSPAQVRANLPHAGYGQGEVVVTPLRLARAAAAIGVDGAIREAPIVTGTSPTVDAPFVSPSAARTLAGYLRDAVVSGTGRALKDHPARIAGKTGTAEVDEAASHAWFAGFAPYGPAERRIAFAVVLEHAGYGGAAAATVAGQVATAAISLGYVK